MFKNYISSKHKGIKHRFYTFVEVVFMLFTLLFLKESDGFRVKVTSS